MHKETGSGAIGKHVRLLIQCMCVLTRVSPYPISVSPLGIFQNAKSELNRRLGQVVGRLMLTNCGLVNYLLKSEKLLSLIKYLQKCPSGWHLKQENYNTSFEALRKRAINQKKWFSCFARKSYTISRVKLESQVKFESNQIVFFFPAFIFFSRCNCCFCFDFNEFYIQ